jgi:hypothetical protein
MSSANYGNFFIHLPAGGGYAMIIKIEKVNAVKVIFEIVIRVSLFEKLIR